MRGAFIAAASATVCLLAGGVVLLLQQRRKCHLGCTFSLEAALQRWSSTKKPDKVLDLRAEEAFNAVRLKGAHNISHTSLFAENRWFELPDKLEALALVREDSILLIRNPAHAAAIAHMSAITWFAVRCNTGAAWAC
jgi:hypothetical protein